MMKRTHRIAAAVVVGILLATAWIVAPQGAQAEDKKAKAREEKQEKKRQAELKKLRNLKDGEFYVVGRIELIPKLKGDEQNLKTGGSGRLKNKSYVFFSNQFVDITSQGMGLVKHAALVPLDETFVIKRKVTDPVYFSGALIMMESSASHSGYMNNQTTIHTGSMYLPGDRVYPLKAGAKALYVGTLKYYRDDYNAIKKVQYVDEYKKAQAEFRKIIGDPKIALQQGAPKKQKGVW